ncbi:carbohydrate ABC transporter permease [Chengkuizengella axinellae]|uniref:Carbohydrate ABC transporter permease n=1 Tax=Chengkuizengella axinellae TaxID=3064388 RepID=A0ABT9IUF9_9BACL|nr:carbohydrate ABC transporter permease [Chengkuizengella sp. 2205SS18-9]MDP5272996.1 carbohydrate ABC transporter permease [Chengkuizengella sp. 2205SS18-9]
MRIFNLQKLIITIFMLGVGFLFLFPFFWMVSASLKPEIEVFNFPIQWLPSTWEFVSYNYSQVWIENPFLLYYRNSIIVTVATTITSVTVSCLAAYGFSKIKFKGRDFIFLILLAIYMVPHQATLVPQFIMFRYMNLYDTLTGLVILNSFSVLGTFLLRQAFLGVNNEYLESARMDGAGHFRIFLSIMLPLVRPVVATYAILRFIWTWNDYQNPFIFLRSEHLFTIQLGVQSFGDEFGKYYAIAMAGAVSAILPLLIVFIIGQKHVIAGISSGGVKG